MRRFNLCLGWIVLGIVLAGSSHAAEAPDLLREPFRSDFVLTADEVIYEEEREVYEAVGNVRIEQPDGRTLEAHWIAFNSETGIGVASGDVRIDSGQDSVRAGFAALNMRTSVAVASKATLDTGSTGFKVQGDSIQRTGVDTYRVERGQFTTCRCPPSPKQREPWEIDVEEARLRVGGYAVAKHLWFRAFEVPVLYVPYLVFPAKTERQTGFLIPDFSQSSRNGAELEIPFFWAVRENVNVTFRPTWLSQRGFKHSLDTEYVFGRDGFGAGGVSILPSDREVDDGWETPYSDDRWAVWLRHEHPLGEGLRFGADLKRISDNDYPIDFEDIPGNLRSSRFVESIGWLTYARDGRYAGVEVSHADDLQSPNDLDRDDFVLQRYPDIRAGWIPRSLGGLPLRFGMDTRYTYFHQKADASTLYGRSPVGGRFFDTGVDGVFDTKEQDATGAFPNLDVHRDNFGTSSLATQAFEGDGRFQEGELLADFGHRVDLYPRVTLPQRLGIFETLSEVGYRLTAYDPENQSSDTRSLWTARFDVRTQFAREFEIGAKRLRHIVEPRVGFAGISAPDQDSNPLFIPMSAIRPVRLIDGDLRVLTQNPADRISDERLLQLQIGNRFYIPSLTEPGAARLFGEVRVGSGYDFLDRHLSRIFLLGALYPRQGWALSFDVGYDTRIDEVDDARLGVQWSSSSGNWFTLSYRYLYSPLLAFEDFETSSDIFDSVDRDVDRLNQIALSGWMNVTRRVAVFGDGYLNLESSSSSGGKIGMVLQSSCRCWELIGTVEHRTRPTETRFRLSVRLVGIGRRSMGGGYGLDTAAMP